MSGAGSSACLLRRCEWRWLKSYRCDAGWLQGKLSTLHAHRSLSATVRWRKLNFINFKDLIKFKHKEKYQDKDTSILKGSSKIACCNRGKCLCLYQPKGKRRAKERGKDSNQPITSGYQSTTTQWRWKFSNRPMPNSSTAAQRRVGWLAARPVDCQQAGKHRHNLVA